MIVIRKFQLIAIAINCIPSLSVARKLGMRLVVTLTSVWYVPLHGVSTTCKTECIWVCLQTNEVQLIFPMFESSASVGVLSLFFLDFSGALLDVFFPFAAILCFLCWFVLAAAFFLEDFFIGDTMACWSWLLFSRKGSKDFVEADHVGETYPIVNWNCMIIYGE